MWKKIRISILLGVLFMVAGNTYIKQRDATDWRETLDVVIYPINGDGSAATAAYIRQLDATRFGSITNFMRQQGHNYEISTRDPVSVRVAAPLEDIPPQRNQRDASMLETVFFSLRMRWWAAMHDSGWNAGDIRMFVVYYSPDHDVIPDSLALPKGLIGLVYAYADPGFEGTNNFVIAHEMLHTLGATDKYDPATNMPLYPIGFANPYVTHRYPQKKAEIMGGRIPVDNRLAYIPNSLDEAVIGSRTAVEINWFK